MRWSSGVVVVLAWALCCSALEDSHGMYEEHLVDPFVDDTPTPISTTADSIPTDSTVTEPSTTDSSTDSSTTDLSTTYSSTDPSTTDSSTTDQSTTDSSTDSSTADSSTTDSSTTDPSTTDPSTTDSSITNTPTTDPPTDPPVTPPEPEGKSLFMETKATLEQIQDQLDNLTAKLSPTQRAPAELMLMASQPREDEPMCTDKPGPCTTVEGAMNEIRPLVKTINEDTDSWTAEQLVMLKTQKDSLKNGVSATDADTSSFSSAANNIISGFTQEVEDSISKAQDKINKYEKDERDSVVFVAVMGAVGGVMVLTLVGIVGYRLSKRSPTPKVKSDYNKINGEHIPVDDFVNQYASLDRSRDQVSHARGPSPVHDPRGENPDPRQENPSRGAREDPYASRSQLRKDPYTTGSEPRRDPYSNGSQVRRDLYSTGSEARRDPYSTGSQLRRDPYSTGSQPRRDPYSNGSQVRKDPYSTGSQPRRDPYSTGSQPRRDPYSTGSEPRRDPYSTGSQPSREPSAPGPQPRSDPHTAPQSRSPFATGTSNGLRRMN